MDNAIKQFRANLVYVRNLRALHAAMRQRTTGAVDLSDLLRAELVMSVSALDQYIHEVVRTGMLLAIAGKRPSTEALAKFSVSLATVKLFGADPASQTWLDAEVRTRHSYMAFQQPEKIADALRLVCSRKRLWEQVGARLGKTATEVKQQIELTVRRRNQIAHEADLDPSSPGRRWPIDEKMVDDTVAFIESVCETIQTLL